MFYAEARSHGNIDFQQFAPVSEPERIEAPTVRGVVDRLMEYIGRWDLGGGNWPNVGVKRADGSHVGNVSYNGRLWTPDRETEIDIATAD